MEKRTFKFTELELRQVSDTEGIFTGYAAVFNRLVPDYNEVVMPGAFTQTLKHHGGKVPILVDHTRGRWIGMGLNAAEHKRGLWIEGKLVLSVPDAHNMWSLMELSSEIDAPAGISMGFRPVKDNINKQGVRELRELKLIEYTPTPFPAAETARVDEMRSVVDYQDLLLADIETPWVAGEALVRIQEWAGGSAIDWAKYQTAFLWCDGAESGLFGSYHLPIADVIDGVLKAVPRGILAAAAAIQGADGGRAVPDANKTDIRANLGRYYKRLNLTPPWESRLSLDLILGPDAGVIVVSDVNDDLALVVADYLPPQGADAEEAQFLHSVGSEFEKVLESLRR